ncbi:hypothetical protein HY572_05815 [Candidatus Micrarchaeota archaeon]|nr:hypothetical protein [Candidatus Micrarchaeota archaeon]
MFVESFDEDWPKYFEALDSVTKERVVKKIRKILEYPKKRHMGKNTRFFVDEAGQHRITYRVFDESNQVRFYFVGDHKQYEKWYSSYF